MGNKKMKKFNNEQVKILKKAWKDVIAAEEVYCNKIRDLELKLEEKTGIPIMVFMSDNEAVGFGDYDRKFGLLILA